MVAKQTKKVAAPPKGFTKKARDSKYPPGEFLRPKEGDRIEGTLRNAFVMHSKLNNSDQLVYYLETGKGVFHKLNETSNLRTLREEREGTEICLDIGPEVKLKKGRKARNIDVYVISSKKGATMLELAKQSKPDSELFSEEDDAEEKAPAPSKRKSKEVPF